MQDERVAILLKSLGDAVTNSVIGDLPPGRASSLRSVMHQLETLPPPEEEITEVLEEFNRFMEFALSGDEGDLASTEETVPATVQEFILTDDPFADLKRLQDYQIAGALRNEVGATIAIVLRHLPDDRVGAIIAQLPEVVRETAFLQLQATVNLPQPLLTKIVESVVERARYLDPSAASDPDHLADEKTAGLLRAMNRQTRGEMLTVLEKAHPDVAERVKGMLFVFEDVERLVDKSVQRLLTEVEANELAAALKNANDALKERVLSNLSKRAKATLLEEIEFLDSLTPEREADAQKTICDVLAQLDQSGELEMIE